MSARAREESREKTHLDERVLHRALEHRVHRPLDKVVHIALAPGAAQADLALAVLVERELELLLLLRHPLCCCGGNVCGCV